MSCVAGDKYLRSLVYNVCLRIFFRLENASAAEVNDFLDEIALVKTIGYHKNIVNVIGSCTVKVPVCLIVEYMSGGDLLRFLRKRRSKV